MRSHPKTRPHLFEIGPAGDDPRSEAFSNEVNSGSRQEEIFRHEIGASVPVQANEDVPGKFVMTKQ